MKIKDGELIYHLTKIENLDSILKKGLLSRKELSEGEFDDIADPNILTKREGYDLNNFIPFHFHPYSAFDQKVKNQYGGKNFIYITLKREFAKENGFKIIPKHPLSGESIMYDYEEGFDKIEWDIMETKMDSFNSHDEISRAKQIKMSECVSPYAISPSDFFLIHCSKESLADLKERYKSSPCTFVEGCWLN